MSKSILVRFTGTVGVAPGTTTLQVQREPGLGRTYLSPYADLVNLNDAAQSRLDMLRADARRVRWDLVAAIGGGSLLVALAAGLIASAIGD